MMDRMDEVKEEHQQHAFIFTCIYSKCSLEVFDVMYSIIPNVLLESINTLAL